MTGVQTCALPIYTVQTEDGEAAADSQTVEYMGYISFDATADVRLGMSVTVTVD